MPRRIHDFDLARLTRLNAHFASSVIHLVLPGSSSMRYLSAPTELPRIAWLAGSMIDRAVVVVMSRHAKSE